MGKKQAEKIQIIKAFFTCNFHYLSLSFMFLPFSFSYILPFRKYISCYVDFWIFLRLFLDANFLYKLLDYEKSEQIHKTSSPHLDKHIMGWVNNWLRHKGLQ